MTEPATTDDRYSRQAVLEGWDQEKIKNTKVIIVGMGALGSVVGINLAQAGIGHLVLIDLDTIEFSNLNRQLLFHEQDVGKFKAEVSKQKLHEVNSEITIDYLTTKVQEIPVADIISKTDDQTVILVDALDNFEARRWLNSIAVTKSIPLVSGGMYGFYGNLQVIVSNTTPCLECQPLIPERELQKACTPPGEFRKKKEEEEIDLVPKEEFFPALGSVSSVIGGLMSQEVLKLALEKEYLRDYLFVDLSKQPIFLSVPLNKRNDCIVCSPKYKLQGIPFHLDSSDTFDSLISRISLQFNISKENISLIHNLKTITDKNFSTHDFHQEGVKAIVYVASIDLSAPIKLSFITTS